MQMLPTNAELLSWETFSEDISSADEDSKITVVGLLEQLNVTRDTSDYLWYMTSVEISPSESFLHSGQHLTLTVQSAGDALHVFTDGQLSGSAFGTCENRKFTFTANANLRAGTNRTNYPVGPVLLGFFIFVVVGSYYGVDKYDLGTGFGHFAIATPDVYKLVEDIEAKGGIITREPGPVKGGKTVIAFAKDPDGYLFELIHRGPTPEPLCQVMLRVGDLDRSIKFYEKLVELLDSPLYNYFMQNDCLNYFFYFQWVLIQIKREFEFETRMRLWEVLWTHYLSEHLHLYICVAILKLHRNKKMGEQMDFDNLLKFINELSGHIDLDLILRDAEALCICAGENGAACIPPGTPPSLPMEENLLYPQEDDVL